MIDFSKPMREASTHTPVTPATENWCVVFVGDFLHAVNQHGSSYMLGMPRRYVIENIPEKPQPKVRYQAQMGEYSGVWQTDKNWSGAITAWLIETDLGDHLPDDERYEYRREVVKP